MLSIEERLGRDVSWIEKYNAGQPFECDLSCKSHENVIRDVERIINRILQGYIFLEQDIRYHHKPDFPGGTDLWMRLIKNGREFIEKSQTILNKKRVQIQFDRCVFEFVKIDPLFVLNTIRESSTEQISSFQMRVVEQSLHMLVYEKLNTVAPIYLSTSCLIEDLLSKRIYELNAKFTYSKHMFAFHWKEMPLNSPEAIAIASLFEQYRKEGKLQVNAILRRIYETLDQSDQEAVRIYTILCMCSIMHIVQQIQDLWMGLKAGSNRCMILRHDKEEWLKEAANTALMYSSYRYRDFQNKFIEFIVKRNCDLQTALKDVDQSRQRCHQTAERVQNLNVSLHSYVEDLDEINTLYGKGMQLYRDYCSKNAGFKKKEYNFSQSEIMEPGEFNSITFPLYPLSRKFEPSDEDFIRIAIQEDKKIYEELIDLFVKPEHRDDILHSLLHAPIKKTSYVKEEGSEDNSLSFLPHIIVPKKVVRPPRKKTVKRPVQAYEATTEDSISRITKEVEEIDLLEKNKDKELLWSRVVAKGNSIKAPTIRKLKFHVHERVKEFVDKVSQQLPHTERELYHGYPLLIADFLVRYGDRGKWRANGCENPHFSCVGTVHQYGKGFQPVTGCFTAAFFKDGKKNVWSLYHHCFFARSSNELIDDYTKRGLFIREEDRSDVPTGPLVTEEVHMQYNHLNFTLLPLSIVVNDTIQKVCYRLTFIREIISDKLGNKEEPFEMQAGG